MPARNVLIRNSNHKPTTMDLRLGNEVLNLERNIDRAEAVPAFNVIDDQLVLHPSRMCLATTLESINVPRNMVGHVQQEAMLTRRGLHVMGGSVDPGFSGRLIVELSNIGIKPIRLAVGAKFMQVVFFEIPGTAKQEANSFFGESTLQINPNIHTGELQVRPYKALSSVRLVDAELAAPILVSPWVLDYGQLPHYDSLDEFEKMFRRSDLKEAHIQEFLETHPWFLVGDEYAAVRPQIILERRDRTSLRPDFFLKPVLGEVWDILEIKLPIEQNKLFVRKCNRQRFASAVYEGVAQLREYYRFFNDESNRSAVYKRHGILSYRPKLTLLIGRGLGRDDPIVERDIRSEFSDVAIVTYEELLARVRNRVNFTMESMRKAIRRSPTF